MKLSHTPTLLEGMPYVNAASTNLRETFAKIRKENEARDDVMDAAIEHHLECEDA